MTDVLVVLAVSVAAAAPAAQDIAAMQPVDQALSLEQAVDLARSRNVDVRMAREQLAKATYLVAKAWTVLLPTISARSTVARNPEAISFQMPSGVGADGSPVLSEVEIQRLYQSSASMSFNWRLLNGRALPLLYVAYDLEELEGLQYRQHETQLLFATRAAYFHALGADEQVAIRRRALENAQAHLDLARARLEVGKGTRVDTLRSEVEVAAAEQTLVQATNGARIAHLALGGLVGWIGPVGTTPRYELQRPEAAEPVGSGVDLFERAYAERLDLKSGHVQLRMAERLETETWCRLLPVLSATGFYAWSDNTGFIGDNTTWQVGLTLQWDLFSGGLTYWELQERDHDIRTAALWVEKTRSDIARQVSQARLNLESARSSRAAAERRAELARQSATLVGAQYEVGGATQLDVLDANRSLADAEAAEALSLLAVDQARLALEQALLVPPPSSGAATAGGETAQAAP